MPRVWADYCQLLTKQRLITRTRKTFDRALRALPITQHDKIWPAYLHFVNSHDNVPETAIRVYRRYLKVGESLCRSLRSVGIADAVVSPSTHPY